MTQDSSHNTGGAVGTTVLQKPEVAIKEPHQFKVLLHNDDYTPMDFVVEVLESVFRKDHVTATRIMMDVHQKGMGICGIYSYEIAETKVAIVADMSRENEYPLKCTMEKM